MAKVIFQCRNTSHPFNDREIPANQPIKIGRAVAGCKPNPDNAYFNCKVLSRNHAVLFYENGKFYLQDTQSSNGTFVNNQKLPTQGPPSPAGTQGTLKGDQNDGRREVHSGDTVQFGVEVVEPAKKGQPAVAHGCIVASLRLFHADGTEQKAPSKSVQNGASPDGSRSDDAQNQVSVGEAPRLSDQEIYELQSVLQEACHREHLLESKLTSLNKIFASLERKDMWNATFQEDFLLSKIQYLQGQLQSYEAQFPEIPDSTTQKKENAAVKSESDKDLDVTAIEIEKDNKTFLDKVRDANLVSDDYKIALIAEWKHMLEERTNYELVAKEALQRALTEKLEATKALAITEERLFLAQTECDNLNALCRGTQKDLLQLVEKFQQQSQMLEELTNTYQESEKMKLSCLESLTTEKNAVDGQLLNLQVKLDEEKIMCEELRAENERLESSLYKLQGNTDKYTNFVNANGLSTDEENEDLRNRSKTDQRSFQKKEIQHENIFKGKNISDLVREMQNIDSEDEAVESENGNILQHIASVREAPTDTEPMSRLNTSNSSEKNREMNPEANSSNHLQKFDELNLLLEGKNQLADLVTQLQTQLEIEREQVRFLKTLQTRTVALVETIEPMDDILGMVRDVSMADRQKVLSDERAGMYMPKSWKELDSGTILAFVFLLIWMFCMAIFEWTI